MMYSLIIHFGITQYELSLTIDIGLLHMYHLSVLPPKQHNIPLSVSRQISIPNVSPNLTDAQIYSQTPMLRLITFRLFPPLLSAVNDDMKTNGV